MYNVQQIDLEILRQQVQEYRVKIELMNMQYVVIDEMVGELISGSLTIDSDSDMRRVCDLTFFVKDATYGIDRESKIWIDKYLRIQIGLRHQRSSSFIWYPLGIFVLNDNAYTYNATDRMLKISCSDLMSKLSGLRSGVLWSQITEVPEGSNIRNVIVETLNTFTLIRNYSVADVGNTVPYDLKFETGSSVHDILSKLRDLYPAWEMFFNTNGTFVFKQVPISIAEPVIIDGTVLDTLIIDESLKNSFNEVKNYTAVYGDGDVYGGYAEISPDNPFSIPNINEVIFQSFSGGDYAKIPDNYLASQRAKYETWRSTYLKDTRTLNTMYIPFLDVNQKISYRSNISNKIEVDVIKRISTSFLSGTMTLDTVKFYPLYEWL